MPGPLPGPKDTPLAHAFAHLGNAAEAVRQAAAHVECAKNLVWGAKDRLGDEDPGYPEPKPEPKTLAIPHFEAKDEATLKRNIMKFKRARTGLAAGEGRSKDGRPGDGKWRAGVRATDAHIPSLPDLRDLSHVQVLSRMKVWKGGFHIGKSRDLSKVDRVDIHCSDSGRGGKKRKGATPGDIDKWNREAGLGGMAYNGVIDGDAVFWEGRPFNKVGAHCKGQNTRSLGICVVGTMSASKSWGGPLGFSRNQIETLVVLLRELEMSKSLPNFHGDADQIWGHRDFLRPGVKECPYFDVGTTILPLLEGI